MQNESQFVTDEDFISREYVPDLLRHVSYDESTIQNKELSDFKRKLVAEFDDTIITAAAAEIEASYISHVVYEGYNKEYKSKEEQDRAEIGVIAGFLFEELIKKEADKLFKHRSLPKLSEEFLAVAHDPARYDLLEEIGINRDPDLTFITWIEDEKVLIISRIAEAKLGTLNKRALQQLDNQGSSRGVRVTAREITELIRRNIQQAQKDPNKWDLLEEHGLLNIKMEDVKEIRVASKLEQVLIVPQNRDVPDVDEFVKRYDRLGIISFSDFMAMRNNHAVYKDIERFRKLLKPEENESSVRNEDLFSFMKILQQGLEIKKSSFDGREVWEMAQEIHKKIRTISFKGVIPGSAKFLEEKEKRKMQKELEILSATEIEMAPENLVKNFPENPPGGKEHYFDNYASWLSLHLRLNRQATIKGERREISFVTEGNQSTCTHATTGITCEAIGEDGKVAERKAREAVIEKINTHLTLWRTTLSTQARENDENGNIEQFQTENQYNNLELNYLLTQRLEKLKDLYLNVD